MEFGTLVQAALVFTAFGFIWGRSSAKQHIKTKIAQTVAQTIDYLERDKYIKVEYDDEGKDHLVRWTEWRK